MKLAIIIILLADVAFAAAWFYRPTYPTLQASVPPIMHLTESSELLKPHIPEAARSNYCTLHSQARTEAIVRLTYGTPSLPDARYRARQKAQETLFPNSWNYVHAGCTRYSATQTTVKYCPICRAAEKEWKRKHE